MRTSFVLVIFLITCGNLLAQSGHLMPGAGAVNMSMGGAATGQPIDVSGTILWNPAGISSFNQNQFAINAGLFFSAPELTSSLPANALFAGSPAISGTTEDSRGVSIMPALAMSWGKEDSKHSFAVSAFGVSGFGVTFEEELNNPLSPSFNPGANSNPILWPQAAMGFGYLRSDYMMMQVSVTYAYEITEKLSIGVQPNLDFHSLKLKPSPISSPGPGGYPVTDQASAFGFGSQAGLFYDTHSGFKAGLSYKTPQYFGKLKFTNKYVDGSPAPDSEFQMDFPGILSLGFGYSTEKLDIALDGRYVFYEDTKGFKEKGWTPTGSVQGFGWKNMTMISFGLQFKGVENLPLRLGYIYNTNPIDEELTFFSTPATAIIQHSFQLGLGYNFSEKLSLNGVFHYGTSSGATEGTLMNPLLVGSGSPYGEIPGSSVSYEMKTQLIMLGINYTLGSKED